MSVIKIKNLRLYIKKIGINSTLLYLTQRFFLNKGALIKIKIPSVKEFIYLRNKTYDTHIFFQIFITEELSFVKEISYLKTIIDAGANIGLSTIYLKNIFPEATIISIEPSLVNYNLLKRNLKAYKNLIPLYAALMGSEQLVTIVNPLSDYASFQVGINNCSNSIKANTLDNFIKSSGFDKIDLVKIDIEGSEKDVFEKIDFATLEKVNAFAIEIHEHIKPGVSYLIHSKLKMYLKMETFGEYVFFNR